MATERWLTSSTSRPFPASSPLSPSSPPGGDRGPSRGHGGHRPRMAGRPRRPDPDHLARIHRARPTQFRPERRRVHRSDLPEVAVPVAEADRPGRLHDDGRRRAAHVDLLPVGAAGHQRHTARGHHLEGRRPRGTAGQARVHRLAPAVGQGGSRLPTGPRPPTGERCRRKQPGQKWRRWQRRSPGGQPAVAGPTQQSAQAAAAAQGRAVVRQQSAQARAADQAAEALQRSQAQAARTADQAAKAATNGRRTGSGTSPAPPGS